MRRPKGGRVPIDRVVAHRPQEILPGVHWRQTAVFAELRVGRQADLAIPLQVERGQVDAVTLARLAEEHGRHFGRNEVVERQSRLIRHANVVLVEHAGLVQLERLTN